MGVSVTVQLETDQSNGSDIDESYATLSGGFGSILLGSTKGSTVKMNVGAPVRWRPCIDDARSPQLIIKPSAVGRRTTHPEPLQVPVTR